MTTKYTHNSSVDKHSHQKYKKVLHSCIFSKAYIVIKKLSKSCSQKKESILPKGDPSAP